MSEDVSVEIDPFTGQPRIVKVSKEIKIQSRGGAPGARGADGQPGAQGEPGEPGADGIVPDDALVELSTGLWTTDFATPWIELDLGTGGYAGVRWRRVGRMVEGMVIVQFGSDYADTPVIGYIIPGTELPYVPRSPAYFTGGGAEVGSFGFITKASDAVAPDPPNGYRHALIPAIVNFGFGAGMFFVIADSQSGITGGGGNLWGVEADNPIPNADLAGAIYVARFFYEAAAAA